MPLTPLLQAYADGGLPPGARLAELPVLGPRFRAALTARERFLNDGFLDGAAAPAFAAELEAFYRACVPHPWQAAVFAERVGFLRHALAHLLRCPDPLAVKADRFLSPRGDYHVAGLGPTFWSALFQALDPAQHPGYHRGVLVGLRRLGLLDIPRHTPPPQAYAEIRAVYARLLAEHPTVSALHLDHLLSLVAGMCGRDLWSGVAELRETLAGCDLDAVARGRRAAVPVRRRLKERGAALAKARAGLEDGLANGSAAGVLAALALAAGRDLPAWDPELYGPALLAWVGRLWHGEDPWETLDAFWRDDPLPDAGPALPTLVLHLRDGQRFLPWDADARRGLARLGEDGLWHGTLAEQYRLFTRGALALARDHKLHPLEVVPVLAAVSAERQPVGGGTPAGFQGFAADTFRFLEQLRANNRRDWLATQRERYHFVLRQPLVELCRALARRYVEPVLNGSWGWDLETSAATGKALSSVCKNDYGRSAPYQDSLWLTFCRRGRGKKKDAQFFVRVTPEGVGFGVRLGRDVREAGKRFRRHVQELADPLYQALCASGAASHCRFAREDDWNTGRMLEAPADLRAWAAGKTLVAGQFLPRDAALLRQEDLVGEILLTFDRLLPVYLCAASDEPEQQLRQRVRAGGAFTAADFARQTHLAGTWLTRARGLLELKRQLILQGVPGTGKTHVARALARWLTAGDDEAVCLVQFHPSYSYEEFVEGIKARSVESDGRHDVTYPVEDGLLCDFAARAGRSPARPFVLVIDEINRGNLPRVFGELLYLLEYRDQSVVLPYSRRPFRLPANLFILGTMNAADRSVALVDQALRRRFSFLDMPPDGALLADWFRAHPPHGGEPFAGLVVNLFDRLNAQLRKDLGPHHQVGHSYFMVPQLDADRLQAVWDHQVRPLVEDYFGGQPARAEAYALERLLQGEWRGPAKGQRPARVAE